MRISVWSSDVCSSDVACCKPPEWGRRPRAPPPSRRPGYNRKAEYGLFASYVIAVAEALLGLLLAIISIFDPTGFGVVRNMTAEITRPVSLTLQGMVSGIGSADEHIVAYVRAGSQNDALRRQVEANRPSNL